jgi:amidophosphoribosyltransferase
MSDPIKHECGIALIRLLKPLNYYQEKYGSALYGIKKMQLIMAKQLNRGQDGAGIGVIKIDPPFGKRYIARKRSNAKDAVADIFEEVIRKYEELPGDKRENTEYLKANYPYAGELIVGHNRYATHSGNSLENLHPFLRQNNWMSRNLVIAGNYNMTNVDELFEQLISLGQHPKEISDNVTMLEKIGHFLDEENNRLYRKYKAEGLEGQAIAEKIKNELDLENVLKNAFRKADGGYHMAGMVGDGNAFIIRDPNGLRPSFYYQNDEVFAIASERPALQTAFNLQLEDIKELGRGNALIISRNGAIKEVNILPAGPNLACSFERIYFSRGSDADIYKERKLLGAHLAAEVLRKIDYDINNTVFSYIPNTAATCFYGLLDGIYKYIDRYKRENILKLGVDATPEKIDEILSVKARREKILVKDVKMRTFITQDKDRDGLVGHVYDVTYGIVREGLDTLVVIDDSIVRGTTLKKSILKILDRLKPKLIVVASSAPIIKYPDCYGIDMSRMNEFAAFRALLKLLERDGLTHKLQETYEKAKAQLALPSEECQNVVKELYDLYDDEELTAMISVMLTPKDMHAEVKIIFQTVENLHKSCPNNPGDWYFTGNYPTPGGMRVVNRSFMYFIEGNKERAY